MTEKAVGMMYHNYILGQAECSHLTSKKRQGKRGDEYKIEVQMTKQWFRLNSSRNQHVEIAIQYMWIKH